MISKTHERSIFILGLGPVGLATTWELLNQGHKICAYDISPKRIESIQKNEYPFPERAKLDIQKFIQSERLLLVKTQPELQKNGNTLYICVGTPLGETGIDLSQIHQALNSLVHILQPQDHVIIRSTLQPGCMNQLITKFNLNNLMVSFYPEFLRELHIIEDVLSPPLKISCHNSENAKTDFLKIHKNSHAFVNQFSDVEMVKVACNLFHALKVTFANEIMRSSKEHSFNAQFVMDHLKSDKKLNISDLYLNPGKAFAGHCLEKDLAAFLKHSEKTNQYLPLMQSILDSNNIHKKFE